MSAVLEKQPGNEATSEHSPVDVSAVLEKRPGNQWTQSIDVSAVLEKQPGNEATRQRGNQWTQSGRCVSSVREATRQPVNTVR